MTVRTISELSNVEKIDDSHDDINDKVEPMYAIKA